MVVAEHGDVIAAIYHKSMYTFVVATAAARHISMTAVHKGTSYTVLTVGLFLKRKFVGGFNYYLLVMLIIHSGC